MTGLAITLCGCAVLLGGLLVARRQLLVVTVVGSSMEPTLADGSRLLVRRGGSVRRGDLVVFRPPREALPGDPRILVKRVAALSGDDLPAWVAGAGAGAAAAATQPAPAGSARPVVPAGTLVVRGDAPRSEDSSTWGPIETARVVGRVVRPARP